MSPRQPFPEFRQTVLDCTDPRGLAEFYRELLGLEYRPGDERPAAGEPDERGQDWLVVRNPAGTVRLAFQAVDQLPETTWPEPGVPQQLHLDFSVPSADDFDEQDRRARELGARLRFDRSDDPEEPLRVYADPAGHLFCLFVATSPPT